MSEPATHDYPYVDTRAAMMLSGGIRRLQSAGISLRTLAKQLGYKQAVVLSHMATGRVPIPVDRAPELAEAVGLDVREFTLAVLRQRYGNVDWNMITGLGELSTSSPDEFVIALQTIAPISSLNDGQRRVMREVAADPNAERRWLSVHEISAIELLRRLRIDMPSSGLSDADQRRVIKALEI